jgi:hypothetical protein
MAQTLGTTLMADQDSNGVHLGMETASDILLST